jgi:hypothetical protein
MKQPVWKFRPMSRGEINVDPIEGEFFSTEILGSLSDAVVREGDPELPRRRPPGQPVRLAVTFPSADRTPCGCSRAIPQRASDHLEAKGSGLANGVDFERPMDFLLIEDFGTRGLAGDIRDDGNQDETAAKNDFYYFWRNIGRAVEGTTTRGRWGLGKTVFQAASRINSFFGLTVRQGEARRLLMGNPFSRSTGPTAGDTPPTATTAASRTISPCPSRTPGTSSASAATSPCAAPRSRACR